MFGCDTLDRVINECFYGEELQKKISGKELCVMVFVCREGDKSFLGVANYSVEEDHTLVIRQVKRMRLSYAVKDFQMKVHLH